MAFKFKTKKRPSLGQAIAGGFAQGVSAGLQRGAELSLQDRLKKQEEEKNRLKTQLDLFNGMIGNIEQSSANREAILRGKQMIIRTDGKVGASQAFSSISPDFTFTPTKAEKEAATKLSTDADIMAAETSAMTSIGMGGLKPSESVVTRREELADIEAGIKADPRAKKDRKSQKDSFGILRFTDTGEQVFEGDAPDRPTQKDVNGRLRFMDDGSLVFSEVEKETTPVNKQLKIDKKGNRILFDPRTGEIEIQEPGTNLSDREKLELRNLMQERTRLLGLKKGESSVSFSFGGEDPITIDSGESSWNESTDQPALNRINKTLKSKYGYDWLGEIKDKSSLNNNVLQRPPSIPEEAWSKSTQEQKVEAVRLYEASLKPTSENVNSMPQGEQSSEVEVSDSGQQPPSATDLGFVPQAPNAGMKFKLPPELVKQFDSGSIVVEEMKGNQVILKTDKGIKKVMPLSKWYTYRFAPMT